MNDLAFLAVETVIVESNQLTANEKTFYMVLKSFRNRQSKRCFPSMRRVVERCGMSVNTAYACRKKLQQMGIIDYSSERGRKHRNHYRFILEDGQEQEIERVLSVLQTTKIPQNEDSLNTSNERRQAVSILGSKIPQNDSTNHKKGTTRNRTHTELGVCVALPEEIQQYIDDKIAVKGDGIADIGAYRAALVRLYQEGKLETSDHDNVLNQLAGPWDKLSDIEDEVGIDTSSDAYRLVKLQSDYNVERNPDFRNGPIRKQDIKYMQDLLDKEPLQQVETVLSFCHQHNIMESFLWDSFVFADEYNDLKKHPKVMEYLSTF